MPSKKGSSMPKASHGSESEPHSQSWDLRWFVLEPLGQEEGNVIFKMLILTSKLLKEPTSNVFPMCFQCVLNVFPMCFQCVFNVFPLCFQCVSNVFSMCFQCVSNVFSMCFQGVSNVFPMCFLTFKCFLIDLLIFSCVFLSGNWYRKWTAIDLNLFSSIRNLFVLLESAHWRLCHPLGLLT